MKNYPKNLIKKNHPKKPTKDDLRGFSELINREETNINHELFRKQLSKA